MHRSIAAVSMSGTLRQKLEAIAAARFDGIELFENDFIAFNGSARELRAMAEDLGLGIDLFQPFRDFEGMPDEAFRKSLDRAERKFDLMQTLGAPLMLVSPTPRRRPSTIPRAPRPNCMRWPSARPSETCASATRRSPGAATCASMARPGK